MNRIVVADDDAGIARILSDRLRNAGHEVDVARDGVEALRMAEGADLLLLDLMGSPCWTAFGAFRLRLWSS
jgi:DNA-binding response OmpR family regulator